MPGRLSARSGSPERLWGARRARGSHVARPLPCAAEKELRPSLTRNARVFLIMKCIDTRVLIAYLATTNPAIGDERMAKWHVADVYGRPFCNPTKDLLTLSASEWIRRIASDQCQRCAKDAAMTIKRARVEAAEAARQAAFDAANAKHPLPISGKN